MLCLVGDSTETLVVDADSGQGKTNSHSNFTTDHSKLLFVAIVSINEHHDYSFACCWHPDGRTFATGNQDKSTRIYDIRNTSKAMHVLGSNVGAIRSLHYSHDGHYLAAAGTLIEIFIFNM